MKRSYLAIIVLMLYGLSGVTALAYEVLWTRMLGLFFGISILGVVVAVAAFMLGLGLGSFLGCRYPFRLATTLRLLAGIEIGVALYALLLPTLMQLLQGMWLSIDNVTLWQCWQIVSALLVLSLPAMALGFAFPAMLRVGRSLSLSLGALYGVNTIGGAFGALLPLFLLPLLGWLLALQSVACLGVLLGLSLLWLSFKMHDDEVKPSVTRSTALAITLPYAHLLAYAGLGAGALMLEIAWTRAYGMILLRTEYVLAVILSVFLVGIGLGSVIAKYLPRQRALQWMPLLVAMMALAALYAFPYINVWAQNASFDSLFMALLFQAALIALCTLPVTLLFGAWLPLIAKGEDSISELHSGHDAGAWLYAANSVGACLGALLAGFVLIPWLGTAATWLLAAALVMLCGCYWLVGTTRMLTLGFSVIVFGILAWPVTQLPPAALLLQHELPSAIDLYHNEDAVSMTHVVERRDGQRILLADLQRMDASSDPTSVEVQRNQARLAMFLQGRPRSVLFLGLGTGITASGALAWPNAHVTAVELSQGAIVAAGHYFDAVNQSITHHITIQHDDARRYLMRSDQYFDVIIGDLFHPDMVGRGSLLSVQQFKRAKQRLNEQGLFVQWLAFNQFDKDSLQVVMRSFAQVFTHNAIFIDGYRIALIGFNGAHKTAAQLLAAAPVEAGWGREGGWTWLGRYWGSIADVLADSTGQTVQGEWSPMIEFTLPSLRFEPNVLPDVLSWLIHHRIGLPEAAKRWSVEDASLQAFKRAWVGTELNQRAQLMILQGKAGVQRLQALAYRANPKDRWAGFALADAMFASLEHGLPPGVSYEQALQRILAIRSDHEDALKAMLDVFKKRGDVQAVKSYTDRLFRISPYARVPR